MARPIRPPPSAISTAIPTWTHHGGCLLDSVIGTALRRIQVLQRRPLGHTYRSMKNASIRIRLTAEQKAQIEAEARRLGLSVSAFMLSAALKSVPKEPRK